MVRPIFIFVVDLNLDDDDYDPLFESVIKALHHLPASAFVGLVSYSSYTKVHELSFDHCSKCFIFDGEKSYNRQSVHSMLELDKLDSARSQTPSQHGSPVDWSTSEFNRFLLPVQNCISRVGKVFSDLKKVHSRREGCDAVQHGSAPANGTALEGNPDREMRCTGAALSVAVALLEDVHAFQSNFSQSSMRSPKTSSPPSNSNADSIINGGSRILLFTAGPTTLGPGATVPSTGIDVGSGSSRSQEIREINERAAAYYNRLAHRAISIAATVDLFVCSLDEVGIIEMRNLVQVTGGRLIVSESFDHAVFQKSLRNSFNNSGEEGRTLMSSILDPKSAFYTSRMSHQFGAQLEVRYCICAAELIC